MDCILRIYTKKGTGTKLDPPKKLKSKKKSKKIITKIKDKASPEISGLKKNPRVPVYRSKGQYKAREKEGDLTQSYYKTPYTNRKFENDNTQTPPKTSITQRLRTDLGRSFGVTSHPTGAVKPGLKGTNRPTHRKSSVINRTLHDRNIVYKTNRLSQRWIHVLKKANHE